MTRWVLGLIAALVCAGGARAESAVERGSYLVNTIMTCGNCHSPKGPPAAVAGKEFSGGLRFNEPPFDVTAPNITPDPETGIGKWSVDDIKKALITGIRPNGVALAEIMPTNFYPILTRGDLEGIAAYLKSLPAVKNKVPDPIYKIALPHVIFPGAEKPYAQVDLDDKLKRGFYLATIGHCLECHTPFGAGGLPDFGGQLGKGGREFPGPWGVSHSRNVTSHREKGIGAWTDAEIKTAITQGKRKDGTPLKPPMDFAAYAKMTDADLDAVISYVRTLPPKE